MKNLFLCSLFILITSCAVSMKKDNPENVVDAKALALKNAELAREKALNDEKNWQHQYYEQAIFKVSNPKVLEDVKKLEAICGGSEFDFEESYQLKKLSFVKFKKYPISITTKSGFSKKVFVTKGVCRELTLYKKQLGKGMRKTIKLMNVLYVYNVGSYVLDVTFDTEFKGVEFFVK